MKKSFFFLLMSMSCMAYAGYFNKSNSVLLTDTSAGFVMKNNCVYYFTDKDLDLNSSFSKPGNGLAVQDSATAFLYIAPGQTLTVSGSDGDGTTPGYAGIRVPVSSTLYIIGGGRLIANGGAAGSGEDGGTGFVGFFIPKYDKYFGGIGGSGGNGGGGGGAGIGSNGSEGGMGGPVVIHLPIGMDQSFGGIAGNDGSDAQSTESCGRVYIVGPMQVVANSKHAPKETAIASVGFSSLRYNSLWLWGTDYVAGGGGAGGSGNNGMIGARIGVGGLGAPGAGGGSSGGVAHFKDFTLQRCIQRVGKVFTDFLVRTFIFFIKFDKTKRDWLNAEIPIIGVSISSIAPTAVAQLLLHFDSNPVQINGAGGEGSWAKGCDLPRRDGVSFWCGNLTYKNSKNVEETLICPLGGKAGQFGTAGKVVDMKRSWLSSVNQDMPEFKNGEYPEALKKALTFDVSFSHSGVDTLKAHAKSFAIVFGDTLPRRVPVPIATDGSEFTGYRDSTGTFWYTAKGEAISNVTDSAGKPLYIFLNMGDLQLIPTWKQYAYVVVTHWIQGTGRNKTTKKEEYGIKECELGRGPVKSLYMAHAKNFPGFTAMKGSDTLTLKANVRNEINFYYQRNQHNLAWDIPTNLVIVDSAQSYTPVGKVRVGTQLSAPQYAKDKATGEYYRLSDWRLKGDTGKRMPLSMPDQPVVYSPTYQRIPLRLAIYNNSLQGEASAPPQWLGTNVSVTVHPQPGMELDTCWVFTASAKGTKWQKVFQTGSKTITWYAAPTTDSTILVVRYRGNKHEMNYQETESVYRNGSMTWFINQDSIGNDGGINGKHEVRTGDIVWIRPEPDKDRQQVCKSVTIRTASGKSVESTFQEAYNALNQYDMHYTFIMPDEDVTIQASYGTLSDELVNLRVKTDTGEVKVYSKRGELLDNKYVLQGGFKVNAGQVVWIELVDMMKMPPVDSVRLRFRSNTGTYSYPAIQRMAFAKCMQDITQALDTNIPPKIFGRYYFQMPSNTEDVLVEFHHENCKHTWESERTSGIDYMFVPSPDALYDLMGRYLGTDPQVLPTGMYVRGGKILLIH